MGDNILSFTMKVLSLFAILVILSTLSAKKQAVRRLQADPVTAAAAMAILSELAKKTEIGFDVNKAVDQLTGALKSNGNEAAIILHTEKESRTFYCMPDVLNLGGLIASDVYCAQNSSCPCKKQWFPAASNQIR